VKKLLQIATILPTLAFAASAQDTAQVEKAMAQLDKAKAEVEMKMMGAVKGFTVKGAPYSGEEVSETNQVLADGTRIHRENRANVYRDSEGRTRRETPDNITIVDPVANVTYVLNPKSMTGQKLPMAMATYSFVRKEATTPVGIGSGAGAGAGAGFATTSNATFTMRMESEGGTPTITVNGQTLDPKQVQELIAKAKARGDQTVTYNGVTLDSQAIAGAKITTAGPIMMKKQVGESIGSQVIEGVKSEGHRTTNTIEVGAIGNDRPIQVTGESWYSPELQTTVMSKHSDPRTGEENFRLIGINRNEPAPYLFQPPSGYTISERGK